MDLPRTCLALGTLLLAGCQCGTDPQDDTAPPEAPPLRDRGQWLSMGALSDGTPVAAYYDRDEDGLGLAIGTVSEGAAEWSYEEVDGFKDASGLDTGDRGTYASLVVGPDDIVWIAYYDAGNKTLRYARRHVTLAGRTHDLSAAWETGVANIGAGSSPNAGLWASIALTPEGEPVIAHYDDGQGELRVTRWEDKAFGGQLTITGEPYNLGDTGGPTKPADVGKFAHLAIGADGTEYVAYYDDAWSRLLLSTGGAAGFTTTTVDESADVGQWPSILVDDDGTLHIAYHDVENQDLKYATGTPGAFTITTVDDGERIGADTEIFRNGDYISILYFDGQDNDIKLATLANDVWESSTLAGSDGLGLGYHNELIVSQGSYYAGCYDYTNRVIWFGGLE